MIYEKIHKNLIHVQHKKCPIFIHACSATEFHGGITHQLKEGINNSSQETAPLIHRTWQWMLLLQPYLSGFTDQRIVKSS